MCPLWRYMLVFIFYHKHYKWAITEYSPEQATFIDFFQCIGNFFLFEFEVLLCAVSLRLNFKHYYPSMGHQHCYIISTWWTDWGKLAEVWLHYYGACAEEQNMTIFIFRKHGIGNRKWKCWHLLFLWYYSIIKAYKRERLRFSWM